MGVDFIEAATRAIVGRETESMDPPTLDTRNRPANFVGVKAPMFSFIRLRGAEYGIPYCAFFSQSWR